MLEVSHLNFAYHKQPILHDLTFTVATDEIVGLVAPNGTGKSTLLKNLVGLLTPASGTISLNGHDSRQDRTAFLQNLFFLEDNRNLYEHLTAREQIIYVQQMWRSGVDVDHIIDLLNMGGYKNKRISKMSLGMRQHVLLATYLAANTPLMLFDEPLNGLDPTSIQLFTQIFTQLRAQGHGIIMSSHSVENVTAMTDRTFFLKQGQLTVCNTGDIDLLAKYNEMFEVKALGPEFKL